MASRMGLGPWGRRRRAAAVGAIVVVCFGAGFLVSPADAAETDDPRAVPHDGNVSTCPSGMTQLLSAQGGGSGNAKVTTTYSSGGRYVTLTFASALTGAKVVAYVKGSRAYNEYAILVGTTDTTLLRAPFAKNGSLPAISHLLVCQKEPPPPPPPLVDKPPRIFVAYVDNFHDPSIGESIPFRPSPWQGDPNVVYVGCPDEATCGKFDGGAIRIDNPSENTVTKSVTAASVVIGACTFTPWTALLPQSFGPGKKLVLTQTGILGPPMPGPCRDAIDPAVWPYTNFDTSERAGDSRDKGIYNCDLAGPAPVINLTFGDGTALAISDTAKILNTGGSDSHACFGRNEAHPWEEILY
jgi:hypothetical protein